MFEISGSGKTQASVLSMKLLGTDHYLPPGRREEGEFFLWGGVGAHLTPRLILIACMQLHNCFALFFVCLFCFVFEEGAGIASFAMVWILVARLSHHGLLQFLT